MAATSADFSFQQFKTDEPGSPKPIPQSLGFHFRHDSTNPAATDLASKISGDFREIVKISNLATNSNVGMDAGCNMSSIASTESSDMPPPKPFKRGKVPFEKGYSQMDWLRLTQVQDDLAGIKGQSNRRLISKEEVKQHRNENDAWTVLRGRVYNITPYLRFHPGEIVAYLLAIAREVVAFDVDILDFNSDKYHPWVNAEFLLEKCQVGILDVPAT